MSKVYHAVQLPLFALSKVCHSCHAEKPLEAFYPRKTSQDGRREACIECDKKRYRALHPTPKHLPPASNGKKICRTCRKEQPIDQFPPDKRSSDRLGTQCKECTHHYAYVVKREETHARTHRNWEKSAEKYNAQHRGWKKANPLKITELNRRRQAKQKAATVSEVDYARILERDGLFCYICEKPVLPDQKINFDHVIPLARGGAHSEENIKVTHKTCNLRKKDKLLREMTPHQRRGIG